MSNEEDRDDTRSKPHCFVVIVFEIWSSYCDDGFDLVDVCVAQTEFSITFSEEGKMVNLLRFRQFQKKGYSYSFMSLNITANLKEYYSQPNRL